MDRYSIALGKKPPVAFHPEKPHSSKEFDGRLRMIVTGDRGSGKSTYLADDIINWCETSNKIHKAALVSLNRNSEEQLRSKIHSKLVSKDIPPSKVHYAIGFSDLCYRGSSYSALYLDNADLFNSSNFTGRQSSNPDFTGIIFCCNTTLFNIPRVIVSCDIRNFLELAAGFNLEFWRSGNLPRNINLNGHAWMVNYLS